MASQAGYMPGPGPPITDPDLLQVVQWTQRELENLARQFTNFDVVQQNVLSVAPDKPREGMNVVADGVHWNPGQGAGPYTYVNGVWMFTGYVTPTPPDLTHYIRNDVSTTTTVGYKFTLFDLGTASSGTVTPNAANGNYQFIRAAGSFTIAPMAADSAIDLMVYNIAGATGSISMTGWTFAAANYGDLYDAVVNHIFIFSLRRMAGISTFTIKALQ